MKRNKVMADVTLLANSKGKKRLFVAVVVV